MGFLGSVSMGLTFASGNGVYRVWGLGSVGFSLGFGAQKVWSS